MKIRELSERSSVPLPTIKYYIREGLLSAGERTQRNQADYGQAHLERLALIRALRESAGLSIEAIARALRAADGAKQDFIVAAVDALESPRATGVEVDPDAQQRGEELVLSLAKKRGWDVTREDVSVQSAARALAVIEKAFPYGEEADLSCYVDAAELIASHEIPKDWAPEQAPDAALRYAVLGTVLFEPFLLALRRMAHCAHTRAAKRAATAPKTPAPAKKKRAPTQR